MGVLVAVISLCAATLGTASPPPPPVPAAMPKIQLGPQNAVGLFGVRVSGGGQFDARGLLDEQELAGDPSSGKGGNVVNAWQMGYVDWYYPPESGAGGGVTAMVDLGSPHLVSDIYAQHKSGGVDAILSIYKDSPFDATPAWSTHINTSVNQPPVCNGWGWNTPWCGWNISKSGIEGRFVVMAALGEFAIGEMVIYGKSVGPPPPPPPPSPPMPPPLMRQFIGINSFVIEPLARQNVAGSIREYHDFSWDEGVGDPCFPHEQAKFSPNNPGFDNDAFYNRSTAHGIAVHPVVQGRPMCQIAQNQSKANFKVVDNNDILGTVKTMDPGSYTQIAGHLFQYAARYGRTSVPATELKLAPGQPQRTATNWLTALEVRNEPNGDWAGRGPFTTPAEHAALLSACYDGHEKTLPPGTGIRNADPTMLVSMGGLSGATTLAIDHVQVMRLWFQKNRKDQKFAADILNFHFYCNDDQTSKGASPEECALEEVARNLTMWRDANEPTLQVWLTEFGYDTDPHSPNLAPAYGPFDGQDVQGMWLVRSYLYLAVAGIDRAHMFMLADVKDDGWTKFETSGLTLSKDSAFAPKKSWYNIATLSHVLGNTTCAGMVVRTGDLRVARFVRKEGLGGPTVVLAAWLTTKTAQTQSVTLNLNQVNGEDKDWEVRVLDADTATYIQLSSNSTVGLQSSVPVNAGTVKVTVGESPVFVAVGMAPEPPSGPVPPITPIPAPACNNMPVGLSCSNATLSASGANGSYMVCPDGSTTACPSGGRCVDHGHGTVTCVDDPASACAGKSLGLFCTNTTPAPGWPDAYVVCPDMTPHYCPTETPTCTQMGATVSCGSV